MGFRTIALQLVMLPVAWVGMLYFQQDSLIYIPQRYKEPLAAAAAVLPDAYEAEALPFDTAEDGQQTAILLRHGKAEISRLYAVFGGNAMLAREFFHVFSETGLLESLPRDIAFLLVDYPGYGECSGTPSKASIKRTSEKALREAQSALEEMQIDASGEKRPLQLGAIGHSIGCAVALELASARQNSEGEDPLRHVMISSPFTSIVDMAGVLLPALKMIPKWLIAGFTSKHAWDNSAALDRLAGQDAPRVDIIHGKQDEICPHSMGMTLGQKLKALKFPGADKAFQSAAGVGHNDMFVSGTYRKWMLRALATRLG